MNEKLGHRHQYNKTLQTGRIYNIKKNEKRHDERTRTTTTKKLCITNSDTKKKTENLQSLFCTAMKFNMHALKLGIDLCALADVN